MATTINVITYNTPGTYTYTPTVGMKNVMIEVLGAGGGSGTVLTGGGSDSTAAIIGGGAGGYCKSIYSASFIKDFFVVTVGAGGLGAVAFSGNQVGGTGGNSSFGPLLLGAGGTGSQQYDDLNSATNLIGGLGGIGAGGNIVNVTGQSGNATICMNNGGPISFSVSGEGGSSIYGSGGIAVGTSSLGTLTAYAGNAPTGFGSGGGGGVTFYDPSPPHTNQQSGGNGANGLVIITEYI